MKTLANCPLPANIAQPRYARNTLRSRIVHIGFGAFHRAHQALMTDRVLNQSGGDWGICEISLSADHALLYALRQQDHLFSLLEKGADTQQAIIIGAVKESLIAGQEGIPALLEKMAEPQVAIVSLTITEKGYCLHPDSGHLDLNHPLIMQDLATPHTPASAPGFLVAALHLRRQRGLPPFTVLSCDNLPENGQLVRNAVLGLAAARDSALATWIAQEAAFPCTMVDRIVPATTPVTQQEVAELLGVDDPCAVICEPFIQWVIEDNFVAGRPAWETAGAQLVDNVQPFEEMKLRMLNGSHSFLAYLGYLAGYQHISDCMEDRYYRHAAHQLMLQEQAPTLRVAGVDLPAYAAQLITRYSNPQLQHRTWQIAMDGTQKLPQRMLESIRWHLLHGGDYRCLTLGVAGWMRYVSGRDDSGQTIELRDPLAEQLQHIVANSAEGEERVNALLSLSAVFGTWLPQQAAFVAELTQAYQHLLKYGARHCVAAITHHATM